MKVSKNVETLASQGAYANLQPGMTIKVFQKIKETSAKGEEKERLQMFEGIILAHKHGKEAGATITVRKKVGNIGVERIFPLNSPFIEKIEIVKAARVRRAKLYFLRNWKKRLLEKTVD
ncbi:MAG: 50S ribosomal protein L19 [Parcubacteria group bacterium CG08_land_8_20_14_0_20_48_21]|nr:MAG: 50S ribosomal protein L19 [Parcubacteria group bacterium CG2_30_48_51]PIS33007.1 MAG: 50S ribosomal protein L19 [Parcubacteria group bacterium CG08_land_8_20_14_0_20_48_21]PIW79559.1 MAG: 50S ribosomal protein L19 [Parcubacteria group bacterium CG_4_8_14_3_um_filter_48_16]PIY77642.1 MAG: 50S ribosomal protein L19 [Parcubacteria group bacterium CG_4_10_14_0_8_um_filter_48_154]PIZ77254.1 MAG: 50S ribosomal protein L19 [bacterium CG_4_10_14_0_2_um_filter_48_144]PJC39915.1 MAG: 50S ribosom